MRFIAAIVNVSSTDDHACMNVVYAGLAKSAPFSYMCDKFHVSDCVKFEESVPFSYTCHNCHGNAKSKVSRPGSRLPMTCVACVACRVVRGVTCVACRVVPCVRLRARTVVCRVVPCMLFEHLHALIFHDFFMKH